MARTAHKMTAFTRLLLFFLIFVPTILAGVSYYKYGKIDLRPASIKAMLADQTLEQSKEAQIKSLEKEIERLKAKTQDKEAELRELRRR